jgi:hypothetical protein
MDSLTNEQRAEIDALILKKSIIPGMKRIMVLCGVSLLPARNLFKERYRQLRVERSFEFVCGDEEYWSCYTEDILDAIGKGW